MTLQETSDSRRLMRCLRCKSTNLMKSGREPYRFVCDDCGQNFHAVMQLVPVEPDDRVPLLEANVAEQDPGTS